MYAIIGLIRRLPWFVTLAIAAGLLWLGVSAQRTALEFEVEKARALAEGPPPVIDIAAFDPARDIHPAREVHLRVQVNPAYNYHLVKQRRKGSDTERQMWVLFDPADAADSRLVRAVILMHEHQRDALAEQISQPADVAALLAAIGSQGFAFTLNGKVDPSPTLKSMALDALAKEGLERHEHMIFVTPFAGRREQALAPSGAVAFTPLILFGGLGGLFLLVTAAKFRGRDRPSPVAAAAPALHPRTAPGPLTGSISATEITPAARRAKPTAAGGLVLGIVLLVIGIMLNHFLITWISVLLIFISFLRLLIQGVVELVRGALPRPAAAEPETAPEAVPASSLPAWAMVQKPQPAAPAQPATPAYEPAIQRVPGLGERIGMSKIRQAWLVLSIAPPAAIYLLFSLFLQGVSLLPEPSFEGRMQPVAPAPLAEPQTRRAPTVPPVTVPGPGPESAPLSGVTDLAAAATVAEPAVPAETAPAPASASAPATDSPPPAAETGTQPAALPWVTVALAALLLPGALLWRRRARPSGGDRPDGIDPFDRLAERLRGGKPG